MACNCNAEIKLSDCDLMRIYANDPNNNTFIYFVDAVGSVRFAHVKSGENPNQVAERKGFINQNGEIEWFSVKEHPCGKLKSK